jgi:hypothetical protein
VVFIVVVSFSPVAGADEADDAVGPMGVAHEEDSGADPAEPPPAQFAAAAVRGIEEHEGGGIGQGFLRSREIHVVARDVDARFGGVPRETLGKNVRRAA